MRILWRGSALCTRSSELSADNRAVLMLVVIEGYRYQDVADMMEIPIGTVMSRLSRARRQLAEAMKDDNVIALRRPK